MRSRYQTWAALAAALLFAAPALAQDQHWSRQFAKPARSTQMGPGTGMSDGGGKPTVTRAAWHDGRLWMAGSWEAGVDATDLTRQLRNDYWHLWTYSPEAGYQVVCHYHSSQGGQGPDGKIYDFVFLPDGRIVVGGSFTRIDNPGGNRYHGVNGLAVFDAKEPTADRWQPLGTCQYNGTVSAGGTVKALAYDPQGNDLWIGGTFGGIRMAPPYSFKVHRYDFDTQSYEPLRPGFGGQKPEIKRIKVDASTTPSTIWFGGKFHWTAGDGQNPKVSGSTAVYSTGLAAYREGSGWRTFPGKRAVAHDEEVLQRAGDYMHFDAVHVLDFLVDGEDIWIVGAFSEGQGTGEALRGIARWDAAREVWTDPTGRGGVGREVFSIGKSAGGKLYFAGAFGGRRGKEFYDGFKDGTPAHMAISFDPGTGAWSQLGSGLSGNAMPECRLAVNGDDVYFVGDFEYIGPDNFEPERTAKEEMASYYIARWNETIDFTKSPPELAGGNAPFERWGPGAAWPTEPQAAGNEHWSRAFPKPPRARGKQHQMSGRTGMDDGTGAPQISGIAHLDGTIYVCGSWEAVRGERWFVWTFQPEAGWSRLGWSRGKDGEGPKSPPAGMQVHDGKLYVYGSFLEWNGITVYDPEAGTWARVTGTHGGKEVFGHGADGTNGAINDVAWDPETGAMYMVGNWAPVLGNPAYEHPKDVAAVIRIDPDGAYHVMGHDLKPEDPTKPLKGIYAICLDPSQDPIGIYVAGTFCYYGPSPTTHARMAFNVARWSYADGDWRPVGKGCEFGLREIDRPYYPEGLPGLPARSDYFQGFLNASFPRVRDLVVDREGNLYAGGTLAVLDASLPVAGRAESFGIAKYDRAQDRWVGCTKAGGVSCDIVQMSWLSDTELLLSGGFVYDERFQQLHNVAVLDTGSGELRPLGGGLLREGLTHTIRAMVSHVIVGDAIYFAGLFDHAGVNANSLVEAPVESAYIACYSPKENLDPNRGLVVGAIAPVEVPGGRGSVSIKVPLTAELTDGEGTITWYERRSDGQFARKGEGPTCEARLRVRPGDPDPLYYVSVTRDGVEGGKLPVRIPLR